MASQASGGRRHVAFPRDDKETILCLLVSLVTGVSRLLIAAGRRRVTDDIMRRCLEFMKMELSGTVALFESSDAPLQHHVADVADLYQLRSYAFELLRIIITQNRRWPLFTTHQEYIYSSFPTAVLLYWWSQMTVTCSLLENRGRYRHLLSFRSSDVEPPPQVAEVGGVPLIGIDCHITKLLRWLALREDSSSRTLRVMSIVGPVGIGKTALAMELHNRLKSQATGGRYYFNCHVMVQMSWRTDERHETLLQDIFSRISDTETQALPSDLLEAPPLFTQVSNRLQNKRYFICIDGLCEESDWDKIKGAFPDNNLGSRILITTRDRRIAQYMFARQMKPLNRLDSGRLFLTRAFGSPRDCGRPGTNRSNYGLLDACGGTPLFINLLADLLKNPQQMLRLEEHWEEAERYKMLRRALSQYSGNHILYQSFFKGEINYQLMMILLYMSMFSYGYKFEKDRLIMRWISEGLARNSSEAEQHFDQLINWDIITSTAANFKISQDEEETWEMHMNFFMQEFLASRSAEIGFAFNDTTLNRAVGSMTRRLVLHKSDTMIPENFDLSQIRFLAVSGAVHGVYLDRFVNLVVLDLEGWENLTDAILGQVCTNKMLLLRHLSIRNCQVRKLPHEIKNLCSLLVLDISYTKISELPLEVFELENLQTMLLRGTRIRQLPNQIVRLNLPWLHTLDTIDLSEQPASFLKALGSLDNLQFLAITWSFNLSIDRSYREAFLYSIKRWSLLQSLTIHCGLGCSVEFLGSLKDPPEKLEKFKVTVGRFASVPKWIQKLDHLSFLQITICKHGTDDLKLLGDLGNLQCLILGLDFIPGEAIALGNEGFRKLLRFSIDCPVPWLSFNKGAMRNLRYLQLKFRSIPARNSNVPSGLENLGSLTEVVLCHHERYANSPSVRVTVEAVKKQVANHPNPIDLFINGTEHDVQVVEEETENSLVTQSGTQAEIKVALPAIDAKLKTKSTCEIEEVESDA